MQRLLIATLAALASATLAFAHFVFISSEPGNGAVRVVLSEVPEPDLAVKMITATKLHATDGKQTSPLAIEAAHEKYLRAVTPGTGTRTVFGFTDFGVVARGNGKPHVLMYYPKAILGDPFADSTRLGDAVVVELIPLGKPGAVRLLLVARGRPVPDAEITVQEPELERKVKTGPDGLTEPLKITGRFSAWARFWEVAPGERDGKKYEELRHYATLVADVPNVAKEFAAARGGNLDSVEAVRVP